MPAHRNVRRYNSYRGGVFRPLLRGAAFAYRNRKIIRQTGYRVGKGIRDYFARAGSGTTTTAQRDIRSQKAPKSKPVNKRFSRKVEKVISSHAGRNTVVFQGPAVSLTTLGSQQNWGFFTLFGCNGTSGQNSDLAKILTFHEDATDVEDPESKNLFFHYGISEVGFTNRNATARCFVDIYEWKSRRNIKLFTQPSALVNSNIADEDVLTDPVGPVNSIQMEQLGVTPYQIPDICKNIKFGKKTTMQLAPGGTSTYTLARKKSKWISGLKVRDSSTFSFDGWTEGLFFVVRGAPGSGTLAAVTTVDFYNIRKYCWRAMDPDAKNEYMQQAW